MAYAKPLVPAEALVALMPMESYTFLWCKKGTGSFKQRVASLSLIVKVLQKQISDNILSRYCRSLLVCKNPIALAVGVSVGKGFDIMSKRNLTLDLHPIYNKGALIDQALEDAVVEAEKKKAKELEIICGKGSGALKKRVLRFLDRKDIKEKYHRIDKDKDNWGRVFVYFRWKRGQR